MVLPQLWLWVIQLGYTDFVQDLQHAKARDQLASLTGQTIVEAASATHTFGAQGECWWAAILACPPRAGSAYAATGSAFAFGDLGKRQWLLQRWYSRHCRWIYGITPACYGSWNTCFWRSGPAYCHAPRHRDSFDNPRAYYRALQLPDEGSG